MKEQFKRTELLLGEEAVSRLAAARVAIFGVGGVGSFVAEGLVRAGVGHFVLIDSDEVDITNLNRQIHATVATVGRRKAGVMRERMLSINPDAEIEIIDSFYLPESADDFFRGHYDYIVDAIDTVTGKIDLAVQAQRRGIRIISSMGAGNKLDPTGFKVADIYATRVCPLAKVMRKELKARGIKSLKVVYSEEEPIKIRSVLPPAALPGEGEPLRPVKRRSTPGSVSFVPSVVGLIIAGEVVKDLALRA